MARASQIFNFEMRISIPKNRDRAYAEGAQPEILGYLKGIGAAKYVFQLEDSYAGLSPEELAAKPYNHNMHFQINANLKTKARQSALLKTTVAWFPGHSVHVAPASVRGKAALQNYCMKSDTRVVGPWADKHLYLGEDLLRFEQFTNQQRKLHDFIKNADPDKFRRAALWVYCPHGGSGKTELAKYCYYKYGWPMFSYGKAADILYVVSKFQNQRCYLFNLSKTKQADVSEQELYAALEGVKDGMFLSTKYESCMVAMKRSHVVVFANHLPKMELMTQGRFKIMKWTPLPNAVLEDDYSGHAIAGDFLTPQQLAAENGEVAIIPNSNAFGPAEDESVHPTDETVQSPPGEPEPPKRRRSIVGYSFLNLSMHMEGEE